MQHASGTHHNRQQRETLRQGEAGVTRRERGLASTSARCAARAAQRASEVRPRTVGSPVGVLGPDELARRFMRAHGGAQRDLLRSWRAPRRASPCWSKLGRGGQRLFANPSRRLHVGTSRIDDSPPAPACAPCNSIQNRHLVRLLNRSWRGATAILHLCATTLNNVQRR